VPAGAARATAARILEAATTAEVVGILRKGLEEWLDLSLFSDRWNLS
jgi:hypothetical protein